MLFRGFAVKYLPFTTTAVACANCSLNRLLYRHSQSAMSKAGHLNGLFFPIILKIVVKFAALVIAASFLAICFGEKFWRDFGEEKKLIIFNTLKTSRLLNKKVKRE